MLSGRLRDDTLQMGNTGLHKTLGSVPGGMRTHQVWVHLRHSDGLRRRVLVGTDDGGVNSAKLQVGPCNTRITFISTAVHVGKDPGECAGNQLQSTISPVIMLAHMRGHKPAIPGGPAVTFAPILWKCWFCTRPGPTKGGGWWTGSAGQA